MDHADRLFAADLAAALPRLRRYARVLVGGREGADELVTQTLAGAWRRPRPPRGSDFAPWLFALMRAAHRPGTSSVRSPDASGNAATAGICERVLRLPVT